MSVSPTQRSCRRDSWWFCWLLTAAVLIASGLGLRWSRALAEPDRQEAALASQHFLPRQWQPQQTPPSSGSLDPMADQVRSLASGLHYQVLPCGHAQAGGQWGGSGPNVAICEYGHRFYYYRGGFVPAY